MRISKRVLYSGRVQGVGFRYTTQELANTRPVDGWVRNLTTGEVELEVEGESDAVVEFLDAIMGRFSSNIEATRIEDQSVQGLQGFGIRY